LDLDAVFRRIGIDKDYSSMDFDGLTVDLQGWQSDHPIFTAVIDKLRPKLVLEVGSWKGASVLYMHSLAKTIGIETKFICIDTWLGSNDTLWLDDAYRPSLMLKNGYPTMFRQFIFNVRNKGAIDDIFPLPMTSTAAAHTLKKLEVMADAIYIDAGHEVEEVTMDLNLYYPLLSPGGAMFGDDYVAKWPGVVKAVNTFCAEHGLTLTGGATKWLFQKPV
jgi:cephalosporin hydroxylase